MDYLFFRYGVVVDLPGEFGGQFDDDEVLIAKRKGNYTGEIQKIAEPDWKRGYWQASNMRLFLPQRSFKHSEACRVD